MDNSIATAAAELARQSLLTFRLSAAIIALMGLLTVILAQRYL
jgi:hypothetical protein